MTQHVEIPKIQPTDYETAPGWWPMDADRPRRPPTFVRCENGHQADIRNHTVSEDGTVTASLLCHNPECGWHVMGRLLDW